MHRLIFVILTLLPHLGFSSNPEATDLNPQQLSNAYSRFRFDDGSSEERTENFLTFDTISEEALDKICRNPDVTVFIVQDELRIDCREYTTNYDHVPIPRVVKRDVDAVLEGSGNGDGGDNGQEEPNEIGDDDEKSAKISSEVKMDGEEEKKESEEEKVKKDAEEEEKKGSGEENVKMDAEENEKKGSDEATDGENRNVSVSVGDIAPSVEVQPTTTVHEEQPVPVEVTTTVKSEDAVNNETPAPVAPSVDQGPETASPTNPPADDDGETKAPRVQLPPRSPEEAPKTADSPPTDLEPKKEESPPADLEPKNEEPPPADLEPKKEELPPKGIETVMPADQDLAKKDETVPQFQPKNEATKKGKSLAEPTNDSDKPKTNVGESTADTKKASKDTSILIFLFVAVVVVGALAFGYNFIKKRKQQSADLERLERGPSAIKRSLQSLTKPEPNEQEMKPLITEKQENELETVEIKTVVENGEGGRAKEPENVTANKT